MQKQTPVTPHKASTKTSPLLLINRRFNAPIEKLFAAFTEAEAIKKWWWPENLYADKVELDFKNGGHYFINMKGYEKGGGGMTGEFEEIVTNKLIVMTDQFADEKGNPISAEQAGMTGTWPETIYITFDFESHNDLKSGFTLAQAGVPAELQSDCIQGWSESFDKLEKYLADQQS